MLPLEDQWTAVARLVLAGGVGGILGWDRERLERPAGLRTHVAVALAASMITSLGDFMVDKYPSGSTINIDPTRVLEAVVTGVAFLGAGTIIVRKEPNRHVQGLTTAASLLVTAALGVAAGLGAYLLVACGTGLMVAVLRMRSAIGDGKG